MKPLVPEVTKIPKRTVLTLTMTGTPAKVFAAMMPSLYGTAYGTKFKTFKPQGKTMVIGELVSAYPKGLRVPMNKWVIVTDLVISDFVKTKDLQQKNPKLPAHLAKRPATKVAQILFVGPYAKEQPAVQKLHEFIQQQKLKIVGPHQEVYLTRPGPKAKTIIRYAVK